MAITVTPENADRGNPFVAEVTDDQNFEDGYVRVVPPFVAGTALTENVSNEAGYYIDFLAADSKAALFWYQRNESRDYPGKLSDRERVIETVKTLLHEAGRLIDVDLA